MKVRPLVQCRYTFARSTGLLDVNAVVARVRKLVSAMLSDEDDISEGQKAAYAAAMQTARPSGEDILDVSGAASRSGAELLVVDSSEARPAKVAFSPFEQASSSREVHASG